MRLGKTFPRLFPFRIRPANQRAVAAQITIGHDSSGKPAEFDIEELLATRLLVQGNSGSGKSHLLRRLLEGAGMVQQVVIDPRAISPRWRTSSAMW